MSNLTAYFDLPVGVEAPAAARRAIASTLRGWGFDDENWLNRVRIVVSELVNNAVIHGGGCLSVDLAARHGNVTIAAADGTHDPPRPRTPDPAGGRGMLLIEALSLRWGIQRLGRGKRVWAQLPPHPRLISLRSWPTIDPPAVH